MKIAFVDRDGTIIRDYPDHEWSRISTPEFLPGSLDALQRLLENGFQIIIITNQYIIDEGFISEQQYQQINHQLFAKFDSEGINILDIFYCPHTRDSGCRSCKPNPGMIERAIEKHPNIKLEKSFVVGDSNNDALLAAHFDMPFYGIGVPAAHPNSREVNSLLEASVRQA